MCRGVLMIVGALSLASLCGVAEGSATVSLTADVTTVAEGGTVAFTVTVTPDTYVQRVVLSYEGELEEDEDTVAPYTFAHQFDTPGDDLTVTATVEYSNGDPDGTDTLDVDVVGLTVSGDPDPLRGATVAYIAESDPPGKSIDQFDWSYQWSGGSNTYQDNDANGDDRSFWYGQMVVDGTLSCSATISGVPVTKVMSITITPRSWTTPITCDQDNEPDWGDEPAVDAPLGANRDRDSDLKEYIFVPRDSASTFTSARTIAMAYYGPCVGWWYVSSCTIQCQRETVINKYIKDSGPLPVGATENFFDRNDAGCFSPYYSAADFVQAVKNHEYRGTPDTPKSIEGHQGAIEASILDNSHDVKKHVETLVSRVKADLESDFNSIVVSHEDDVYAAGSSEAYMNNNGPNWGGYGSLGYGQHSRWDPSGTIWTGCTNDPMNF